MRERSHRTSRPLTERLLAEGPFGLLLVSAAFPGCGGGGASSGITPPPPPTITIAVSPPGANVLLGKTISFTATVKGTTNTAVAWSVNSVIGGTSATGTVSPEGLYTAPADLPSPASVMVTATSSASPASSANAQVTVTSDISVAIAPVAASVELGATQAFSALLSSAGQPDPAIHWSLNGAACPASCGSIDGAGNYTAPQILPSPATVTIVAQSAADPSRQAAQNIAITSHFTLQLNAPGTVATSSTALIVATLTPPAGSNPSAVMNWSLTGAGCSGSSCGTLSAVTTPNASNSGPADTQSANYFAPSVAPSPDTITITATPQADPSKKAQANIAVLAGLGVTVTPVSATVSANHRLTVSVAVSGTANSTVTWSVNGTNGGNSTVGQICVVNSSPCAKLASSNASQVDYLAPGSLPSTNPVSVVAASAADESKSSTAHLTILNHDVVSILPGSVTLAPGAVQKFSSAVLGTTNQSVIWQLQGAACASTGACGVIFPDGTYTAPGSVPSPDSFQVVAISSDDSSQSASASVSISSGANIASLHPASVYAGAASGFLLRVDGGGFRASSPGPGSSLLIAGSTRTANCSGAAECTAPVFASDVAVAGNVSVQIENPDGSRSNTVSLVAAIPNSSDDNIALTNGSPTASGKDIVVVEPTTAGASLPGDNVDLDIAALGNFSAGTNTCTLAGNPIVLTRPAGGAATYDLCLFSQAGLDTSMSYSVTGSGDVVVVAKLPAGLGIIHLTLQVQSTAQPGARTLFIQNANLDKTAASGVLEVQ